MTKRGVSFANPILAGFFGTVCYTAASAALKRRGIGVSTQPGEVATALGGREAARSAAANAALHWGYGIYGGVVRAALARRGLSRCRLEAAHLGAVWLPWRVLLALSGKKKPGLLLDCGKHLVYVLSTGAALRLLSGDARRHD